MLSVFVRKVVSGGGVCKEFAPDLFDLVGDLGGKKRERTKERGIGAVA